MRRRRRRRATKRFFVITGIFVLLIAAALLIVSSCAKNPDTKSGGLLGFLGGSGASTPSASPSAAAPTPTPIPTPAAVTGTRPEDFGVDTELNLNGSNVGSFQRKTSFSFQEGGSYTDIAGILTFRGSHWRQNAAYGNADIQKKALTQVWMADTASLPKGQGGSGSWTGNGWTGQPILVKWPDVTRRVMNLNEGKKAKDGLVEVIYASMDGMVHFLDLDDGARTRDKIDIGITFKGAGSLDPRGYPLLYLGAGDSTPAHHGREEMLQEFFIYSLIDGKRLYSFGKQDPFAQRAWHAYDSSALVDAGTDTLIEPGENGILYTLKLNSAFDPAAGTVSVKPSDMLKLRYTTARSRKGGEGSYWLGMEASAAMWHKWLYVSDNCGTMLCIDTDTMQVVWAQDTLDDSNSSPVLEEEGGRPYLYTSTSLHWTQDSSKKGQIPIWKIDGLTGEILWQVDYTCHTVDGVSGGVEGSGLLGKNDIKDLIIYPVARTPNVSTGVLVALDKHTGKTIWTYDMQHYAWSSPVAVYDKAGKGYVIICDSAGNMSLLDGKTGSLLDQLNLGANIEASPSVYENMIVVGTRGQKICGVRIE